MVGPRDETAPSGGPDDPFDLERFVQAQSGAYATALAELRAGRKQSHWIWYVFPQVRGLGSSRLSSLYGVSGLPEAQAYLAHPVLGPRLRECVQALMAPASPSARDVLGELDAMKLRSSLTLYAAAAPGDPLFRQALGRHFGGQPDPKTMSLLDDAAHGA